MYTVSSDFCNTLVIDENLYEKKKNRIKFLSFYTQSLYGLFFFREFR